MSWEPPSCQEPHLVVGFVAESSAFLPDLVGSRTLALSISGEKVSVGVPVRQGEPLSRLHAQRGHLAERVTARERKILVFIHGNTPETGDASTNSLRGKQQQALTWHRSVPGERCCLQRPGSAHSTTSHMAFIELGQNG